MPVLSIISTSLKLRTRFLPASRMPCASFEKIAASSQNWSRPLQCKMIVSSTFVVVVASFTFGSPWVIVRFLPISLLPSATVKCLAINQAGIPPRRCLPPTVAAEDPNNRENLVKTSMLNNNRAMASISHSACIESIYAIDVSLTGEIRAEDQRDRLYTFSSLGNFKRTDSDRRKHLLRIFLLSRRGFCGNRQWRRQHERLGRICRGQILALDWGSSRFRLALRRTRPKGLRGHTMPAQNFSC